MWSRCRGCPGGKYFGAAFSCGRLQISGSISPMLLNNVSFGNGLPWCLEYNGCGNFIFNQPNSDSQTEKPQSHLSCHLHFLFWSYAHQRAMLSSSGRMVFYPASFHHIHVLRVLCCCKCRVKIQIFNELPVTLGAPHNIYYTYSWIVKHNQHNEHDLHLKSYTNVPFCVLLLVVDSKTL